MTVPAAVITNFLFLFYMDFLLHVLSREYISFLYSMDQLFIQSISHPIRKIVFLKQKMNY